MNSRMPLELGNMVDDVTMAMMMAPMVNMTMYVMYQDENSARSDMPIMRTPSRNCKRTRDTQQWEQ